MTDLKPCEGCGATDKAPGVKYCPMCEEALNEYEAECFRDEERRRDYARWVEENGPDGHGW